MTLEELDYRQSIRLSLSVLNPPTKRHNPPISIQLPYSHNNSTFTTFPLYPISLNSLIPDLISLRTKGRGQIYHIMQLGSYSYSVLPEYSLPHTRKLRVFGNAPPPNRICPFPLTRSKAQSHFPFFNPIIKP
jgi:hypothetical protein